MRWVEVEYRRSAAAEPGIEDVGWRRLKKQAHDSMEFTIPDLDVGETYDVRARYTDDDAAFGDWFTWPSVTVERPEGAPDAPTAVRMTCSECIVWDMPGEPQDLAGFLVRHAPEDDGHWGRAEPAHQGLVNAPFPLCAVPRGRRTYLVKAVDHDGNESAEPGELVHDRGDLDDAEEHTIREVDYRAQLWPGSTQGATVAADLESVQDTPVAPGCVMWLSDLEPAWSVADAVPAWTDPNAPAWGKLFGGSAIAWRGAPLADRWVAPYQWMEYVFSLTVDPTEEGPETVLSLDVVTSARRWRLAYRRRYPVRAWTGNPTAPYWTGASNPVWSQDAVPFGPWPGRLVGVKAGRYDFRLLCAAQFDEYTVSVCKARLSEPQRVVRVPAQSVSLLSSRAHPGASFRELLEVRATRVGSDASTISPAVQQLHRRKGPVLSATQSGTPVDTELDVVLIGHGTLE